MVVVDALSRRYIHFNTLNTKLLGFEYIKELYPSDNDFGTIYVECRVLVNEKIFRHDGFLFKENRLFVPNCSMHELLIREAHERGLMRHFRIAKIL